MMLDDIKKIKIENLKSEAHKRVNKIRGKYLDFEVESFADQRSEWRAWKQDNNAPTPVVDKLAEKYGASKADFMAIVEANVLEIIEIQGDLRVKIKMVEAATSEEEVNSIRLA